MKALVISFFARDADPWIDAGWDVEWCDAVIDAKDRLAGVDMLVCPKMKLLKLMETVNEDLVPNIWCDIGISPAVFYINNDITPADADITQWVPTVQNPYPPGDPHDWPEVAERLYKDQKITGLWKRDVLFHWLEVENENNESGTYHLAFLDANDLKKANDEHGHDAGDKLLFDIGQAIEETLADERAIVVRWSGDEYVAIWRDGMTDKEFRTKFDQQCRAKQVSASLGVVKVDNLADGVDKEVKDADLMMQADKKKRKAGREYANQLSFRQRLMGVKPQGPIIQERREINSPILWVWSQDPELQETVNNVALAMSWGLAEQHSLPTLFVGLWTDEQRKKLRVPSSLFRDTEIGKRWQADNEAWQALLLNDLNGDALLEAQKSEKSVLVVNGSNTPPPPHTVDVNIIRDRISKNILVVTPTGHNPIISNPYPSHLAGRPDARWSTFAEKIVKAMVPSLHRFV